MSSEAAEALAEYEQMLKTVVAAWNTWSPLLATLAVVILVLPLILRKTPDLHPLLLTRQSNVSSIRNPGESAVYRNTAIYDSQPLVSGLQIRDPDAPAWKQPKDGDIRDVLRSAVKGTGAIFTIRGHEERIEHKWSTYYSYSIVSVF
jgi:hypothetical protein